MKKEDTIVGITQELKRKRPREGNFISNMIDQYQNSTYSSLTPYHPLLQNTAQLRYLPYYHPILKCMHRLNDIHLCRKNGTASIALGLPHSHMPSALES